MDSDFIKTVNKGLQAFAGKYIHYNNQFIAENDSSMNS